MLFDFLTGSTAAFILVLLRTNNSIAIDAANYHNQKNTDGNATAVVLPVGNERIYDDGDDARGKIDDASTRTSTSTSMEIYISMVSGAATLFIDKEPWFELTGGMHVVGWNSLRLASTIVTEEEKYNETNFGKYTNVTFVWKTDKRNSNNNDDIIHTSFLIFDEQEMIIFEQYFETGWISNKNRTNENEKINDDDDSSNSIVAGFPVVNLILPKQDLGFLWWGGCFSAETRSGDWNNARASSSSSSRSGDSKKRSIKNDYTDMFDGNEHGQPWVLHDSSGRTAVWSSLDNFFVSGFAARGNDSVLDAGLRTTLDSIPVGHHHTTILVTGNGINATMVEWGDVLLKNGDIQKERSNVYDDFSLAHLGYWTDNGAYHYNGAKESRYNNIEEALLGVKDGMKKRGIPIQNVQWDDW